MPQQLARVIYVDMLRDKETYSDKLELIERLYSGGPTVSYLEIRKWTDIGKPKKIFDVCDNFVKLGLLEKGFREDDKIKGVAWKGYGISENIYDLVKPHLHEKYVKEKDII